MPSFTCVYAWQSLCCTFIRDSENRTWDVLVITATALRSCLTVALVLAALLQARIQARRHRHGILLIWLPIRVPGLLVLVLGPQQLRLVAPAAIQILQEAWRTCSSDMCTAGCSAVINYSSACSHEDVWLQATHGGVCWDTLTAAIAGGMEEDGGQSSCMARIPIGHPT